MPRTVTGFGRIASLGLLAAAAMSCTRARLAPRAVESTAIVVAATTDVHGRVTGWDYYAGTADTTRGLARAATIIDSVRAANPGRVVLMDAGDLLQGNPLAFVAARVDSGRPNPIIPALPII